MDACEYSLKLCFCFADWLFQWRLTQDVCLYTSSSHFSVYMQYIFLYRGEILDLYTWHQNVQFGRSVLLVYCLLRFSLVSEILMISYLISEVVNRVWSSGKWYCREEIFRWRIFRQLVLLFSWWSSPGS